MVCFQGYKFPQFNILFTHTLTLPHYCAGEHRTLGPLVKAKCKHDVRFGRLISIFFYPKVSGPGKICQRKAKGILDGVISNTLQR